MAGGFTIKPGRKDRSCHQFQLFRRADSLYLRTNEILIGKWSLSEEHLFMGKVFLELLNKAYHKEENDWMAVMHGSAISDGKHSIILTGDSGKGRSTTLAVILANGFIFMSDDFVPIESVTGEVYQFPTAISDKRAQWKRFNQYSPHFWKQKNFITRSSIKKYDICRPFFPKNSFIKVARLKPWCS
ncbi:MAG: hypothetical protein KAR19_18265 [Bacteroidales bacterium]|nr:hypothetical protein [Bacteroidales bacterium]